MVVRVSPITASTASSCSSHSTRRTYVSEAIPVLDLAAVLWNGGQPLLVFHEIPRFFRLLDALQVGLTGRAREHHQRDEKARDIRNFHHGSRTKKPTSRSPAVGFPLLWEGGCWSWFGTTNWLASTGCSCCCWERERGGGEREGEVYLMIVKYVTDVIFYV